MAEKSGKVHEGDKILEINNISLLDMPEGNQETIKDLINKPMSVVISLLPPTGNNSYIEIESLFVFKDNF